MQKLFSLRSRILKIIVSNSIRRPACAHKQQILIEGDNFLCASSLSLSRRRVRRAHPLFRLPVASSRHRRRYLWIKSFPSTIATRFRALA